MANKVYVGNMNYATTEQSLHDLFSQYGQVQSCRMVNDRDTGRFKGFAFVEMSTDEEAQAAIAAVNGLELDGRALRVNEAFERKPSYQRQGGGGDRHSY
ncbi:MAG: RNA-binding protein [Spirochaetaceae bacterium]|nr:MAG: RNA-binding protein [Spirochaetaceae bacterium]